VSVTRSFISFLLIALTVALGGCDAFPQDPNETTEHVRQSGEMRAGLIAGADQDNARQKDLAEQVASAVEAKPVFEEGTAEILVPKLEKGELDIVIGAFAKSTPWKKHAAVTKPAEQSGGDSEEPKLRALVRKGENRWLMLVERQVTAQQPQ
jgi:ABC-type amino acid transport substrate-binding protein